MYFFGWYFFKINRFMPFNDRETGSLVFFNLVYVNGLRPNKVEIAFIFSCLALTLSNHLFSIV